jgi:hypothetical protein
VTLSSGSTSYQVTSAAASSASPGAYEFDNVQPGTYTLSFTRPGGLPTSSILTLTAGTHKVFNPVLAPAAAVFGVVVKTNTNTPAAGAEVRLFLSSQYPSGTSRVAITDSNGAFAFTNVDAPQSYVVQFAFPPGSAGQNTKEIPNLGLSQQLNVCSPNACTVTTQ